MAKLASSDENELRRYQTKMVGLDQVLENVSVRISEAHTVTNVSVRTVDIKEYIEGIGLEAAISSLELNGHNLWRINRQWNPSKPTFWYITK
jgi:hypothetical protein